MKALLTLFFLFLLISPVSIKGFDVGLEGAGDDNSNQNGGLDDSGDDNSSQDGGSDDNSNEGGLEGGGDDNGVQDGGTNTSVSLSGTPGSSSGFRWWKVYHDGKRPLDESEIKFKSFSKEFQDLNYSFNSEKYPLNIYDKNGIVRVNNKIVVKNTANKAIYNIKLEREMLSSDDCIESELISIPFVNYNGKEFTIQKIDSLSEIVIDYSLELKLKDSSSCRAVESVKILDSSLNEFYGDITMQPLSETYFQFGPVLSYNKNGFDSKVYLSNNLVESGDEAVVKMVFTNVSGEDKGYSEFNFRYLPTKIDLISTLYGERVFNGKVVWSREYVKKGEEVIVYLKIVKK